MQHVASPVLEWLDSESIDYDIVPIPLTPDEKPVRSLEQLAASEGLGAEQIVRSILFRTGGGAFVMLALAGGMRADWGALRKHLGERRLALADPAEVLEITGAPVGAVAPVVLKTDIPILADESIFDHEKVWMGSGVLGYAIALSGKDLQRAFSKHRASIGRFGKPPE